MKQVDITLKSLCIIGALLNFILPVYAQQAFYVYRNDGRINVFNTADIDSITYSRINVDGSVCDDYVVNEIHTPDSLYRIQIAVIDSVGFVTPETVYKANVKKLDGDIRSHLISRNDFTLYFSNSIPNSLLPSKGDKLFTSDTDSVLTSPFIGKVTTINETSDSFEVVCEPVELTDIFECYYGIVTKKNDPEDASQDKSASKHSDGFFSTGFRRYKPGKLSSGNLLDYLEAGFSYKYDDNLSYGVSTEITSISITPTIDYTAYLIINDTYGVNLGVTAIGQYNLEETLSVSGNINLGFEKKIFSKAIPIPEALIDIEFEFGVFAEGQASVSSIHTWTQDYKHIFHWEWSNQNYESLQNVHDFINTDNSHTGKIAINGGIGLGAYGKIGVAFIATSSLDIAEIGLKCKGGISLEGTYVPNKKDEEYAKINTDLYSHIKDVEIGVYGFRGLTFDADLFKWSSSVKIPNFFNIPINNKEKIGALKLVPLFEDTKLELDDNGVYDASTKIIGDVLPTDIGFALINEEDNSDATYSYCAYDYTGPNADAFISFYDKSTSNKYRVYPLVKLMGMELLAEPSAVIDRANITFKKAEMGELRSEPKYNGDGELLFTWYTASFSYIVQIEGAELIEYIRPIILENDSWSYNGNKTKVPGNGLFSVKTNMSYDNEADMNWSICYEIKLKDGNTVYSSNTLKFGGTPENPTVTTSDDYYVLPSSRSMSSNRAKGKINNPCMIEFVEIQ